MTAEIRQLETTPGPGRMAAPQLRTLVVCDIADSTALVERMGDQNAAKVIRKHDRLARALVEQHKGREIDKTDGFLLLFDRPVQAAAFALDYQRGLKHMSAADGVVVRARVGIHMGDVVIWENAPEDVARGAKPIEVEGLVKPVAARLAQLARPQQILMSSAAAGIAHRAEGELGVHAAEHVRWKDHGRYRFKGLPEPLDVVEVGEDDVAPLHAPKSGRTAKKILPWWRRPLTLAAEAAMLLVGLGVGAWFLLQSPPTLAFGVRDWVVVGDLHNLTGDRLFDQSVDSALRISLEQSQYVNVLPELSVQQTLQRMELNPDKTQVNRAIGAQVALREGARALVLPTVADVGGRVRVTAEVIDPNTQATVYSVSADGVGAQSVLPSLDSVSKQLRGKLGEALAMVSKQSQPLAQVATPDLNALKAYSLGEKAYATGDMKDVIAYQTQALEIDPSFALARVALMRVYVSEGDNAKASLEMKLALQHLDRLTPREKLYLTAWKETFEDPTASMAKWKMLATVYPDFFAGVGSYSFFSWRIANDYPQAISAAKATLAPQNPNQTISRFFLGNLYLGEEKYDESLKSYTEAVKDGIIRTEYLAAAYAVKREFAKADYWLRQSKPSGIAAGDLDTYVNQIAIRIDEGKWDDAYSALSDAEHQAVDIGSRSITQFALVHLSLRSLTSPDRLEPELASYVASVKAAIRTEPSVNMDDNRFRLAFAAYLAARNGDVSLAKSVIGGLTIDDNGLVATRNMYKIARAELALVDGDAAQAIRVLRPLADGTELFVTHVALLDAYRASKDYAAATSEAEWLIAHRGRAYSEYSVQWITTAFNVAESDLASLNLAELSIQAGDKDQAKKELAEFYKNWPNAGNLPWLASRIHAVNGRK
jgi:putative peptide modification system cyclase